MSPGYKGGNVPPSVTAAADAYVADQDGTADADALHAAFVAGAAHVQDAGTADGTGEDTGAITPPA
jgi:hypothetical protein